ncbi:MAG: reductive dehalogenase [Deltaproteobacteria bacterium]|nr:reductive dehalogenase [Deltaproteobacteria bacterium]
MDKPDKKKGSIFNRRQFLKVGGLAAFSAQAGGLIAAGKIAGSDQSTHSGWESSNPKTQFFNRKPFEFTGPAFKPVDKVIRPSYMTDFVFKRIFLLKKAFKNNPSWKLSDPIEKLGLLPPLVKFYKTFPERLEWDYRTFKETIPQNMKDMEKYGNYYKLADAYSQGFENHSASLPRPQKPPEESDFEVSYFAGMGYKKRRIGKPVPFKSPELAAKYIKEIAHRYGATLVGITKTNPDFLYAEDWRGCPKDYDFSKLPTHWEYSIVIGVPMEWDILQASPHFSTSFDAYDRISTTAVRLEGALKNLGYPARTHSPMTEYDLIVPPIAIDAGLGELARTGYAITPELGGNCRMAVVTTSLPMATDKPIKFGVEQFCSKCKICADSCPSGAISKADSYDGMVIRGYEHWYINNGACYNFWREALGPIGCRLCIAVCPFSRKNNFIHKMAKDIDSRDPTGIANSALIWMQKNFFEYPDAVEYRRKPLGRFATFRPAPEFFNAENYLNIKIVDPSKGG